MNATDDQLQLFRPPGPRPLFSSNFLDERLPAWPEFKQLETTSPFSALKGLWDKEKAGLKNANEAQTEDRFIKPILRELGFKFTVQTDIRIGQGRRQPDYALFLDDKRRREADKLGGLARYQYAVAVADAKRFDRPLSGRKAREGTDEDPEAQIINYILATKRGWGILTNGRLWRLYAAEGGLIEGACYEVDLVAMLEGGGASRVVKARWRYTCYRHRPVGGEQAKGC